jgi:hypothetical protein
LEALDRWQEPILDRLLQLLHQSMALPSNLLRK